MDCKFYGRGLSTVEVDAGKPSITCPACGYSGRKSRVNKETFKCRKCGFTFNAQHAACLNLFSCSDDGLATIRSGVLVLVSREAGSVVPVDAAPDEPSIRTR